MNYSLVREAKSLLTKCMSDFAIPAHNKCQILLASSLLNTNTNSEIRLSHFVSQLYILIMKLTKHKNYAMTFQTSQTAPRIELPKFIRMSILMILTVSFITNMSAQEIIHESAGDSYSLYKAESNDQEVIFRADRIEILQERN